jgi:hypothetical protein
VGVSTVEMVVDFMRRFSAIPGIKGRMPALRRSSVGLVIEMIHWAALAQYMRIMRHPKKRNSINVRISCLLL